MDEPSREQPRTHEVLSQAHLQKSLHLESLPNEVLVAILCAVRSTADLDAVIRASPVAYRAFVSAKQTILLSIVVDNLGLATRDAVAAIVIVPKVLQTYETYLDDVNSAVRRYKALPQELGVNELRRVLSSVDMMTELFLLNRSVQFFIDEFAASRQPDLRGVHPDAACPLTISERRRLAAALLRWQVLLRVEVDTFPDVVPDMPARDPNFDKRDQWAAGKLLELFPAWQVQQIAEIDSYMGTLYNREFPSSDFEGDLSSRPDRNMYEEDWLRIADLLDAWDAERIATLRDFAGFRNKIIRKRAQEEPSKDPPSRKERVPRPQGVLASLTAGPLRLDDVAGTLAEECAATCEHTYQCEDEAPRLAFVSDDDEAGPPSAWVDGHNGVNCKRWGKYLDKGVYNTGWWSPLLRGRLDILDQWRRFGLFFWDKERVELIKEHMPQYSTGWLAELGDERQNVEE